eukprot:s7845_g2.t1
MLSLAEWLEHLDSRLQFFPAVRFDGVFAVGKVWDSGVSRHQEVEVIRTAVEGWLKAAPPDGGSAVDFFDWIDRNLKSSMSTNESIVITNILNLLSASLRTHVVVNEAVQEAACLRAYSVAQKPQTQERACHWTTADLPRIFEYVPDPADKSRPWKLWAPAEWKVPKLLRFSALLIPTMDSCRAEYMIDVIAKQEMTKIPPNYKSSLMVGSAGTAKTSTAKMFLSKYPLDVMLSKRINFSSATTPLGLQRAIEGEVERKTGKTFCPPGGKQLTVFLDDASMPLVNKWGDQVTNELTRQLIEFSGFYFLDRDKRGEFKKIEQLKYLAAMGQPGGCAGKARRGQEDPATLRHATRALMSFRHDWHRSYPRALWLGAQRHLQAGVLMCCIRHGSSRRCKQCCKHLFV